MASSTPTSTNIIEEFEDAFQKCLGPLTKEDSLTAMNLEELKNNADANAQRLLDMARNVEAFFLQKRFQLSAQKPELILKEDIIEIRTEIQRKDELIKRHMEKIGEWQQLLSSIQLNASGPTTTPGAQPPGIRGTGPPHPQSSQAGGTMSMGAMAQVRGLGGAGNMSSMGMMSQGDYSNNSNSNSSRGGRGACRDRSRF